jgi:Tfp pilus assembly protein PilX
MHSTHQHRFVMRSGSCHGFALPTLMLILAMSSIATLLALRHLWVNAQMLNAEADQLRSQHNGEAALSVALNDIVGAPTNTDGHATPDLRHTAGMANQTHAFFPNSMAEYTLLRQRLSAGAGACSTSICAPNTLEPQAEKASHWKTQTATAMTVSTSATADGNHTAWYWVEVFPQYSASSDNPSSLAPFVYRITTLANGVIPGSTTVLQAIWVRNTSTSHTGQWRSWQVLHD